jgi:VWFA-related protein
MRSFPKHLTPVAVLLSFFLPVITLSTQESSSGKPPSQNQSQPMLKTTTRLVQVSVIVQNKKGEPVTGLKAEDFTLYDEGQQQKIAAFSFESSLSTTTSGMAKALAPNVFTNRFEQTGQPSGNVTVVLFDALNTPLDDQQYARQQIIKFVRQLHADDHVAIYLLTTKLQILHEFTQDMGTLLAALNNYKGDFSTALSQTTPSGIDVSSSGSSSSDASNTAMVQQFLNSMDGQLADFANVNRAETTASALEAIAEHVSRIPGRKNLVWVSAAFPIAIGYDAAALTPPDRTQRDFTPELERAAEAMNQANMAIYPVDARGLIVGGGFSAANRSAPMTVTRGIVRGGSGLGADPNNFFTMNMLAERTGGKPFYNNNDLTAGARAAIADGQSAYMISFYPTHNRWDGKFHELKIKVDTKGIQVRYRKGYFATPDPADKQAEAKAALDAAVWSPVESTAMGMQVTVNPMQPLSARTLEMAVGVDTREISFQQKDDRHQARLELLFLQLGPDGKFLNGENKALDLNLQDAKYQSLVQTGVFFVHHMPVLPETTVLRVVLRDTSSGAIGTVTIPVTKFLAAPASPSSPANSSPTKN